MIDYAALKAILPCLNHVRTVRLNGARLEAEAINRLADIAAEVRKTPPQLSSRACARLELKRLTQITPVLRACAAFIGPTPSMVLSNRSPILVIECRRRAEQIPATRAAIPQFHLPQGRGRSPRVGRNSGDRDKRRGLDASPSPDDLPDTASSASPHTSALC